MKFLLAIVLKNSTNMSIVKTVWDGQLIEARSRGTGTGRKTMMTGGTEMILHTPTV